MKTEIKRDEEQGINHLFAMQNIYIESLKSTAFICFADIIYVVYTHTLTASHTINRHAVVRYAPIFRTRRRSELYFFMHLRHTRTLQLHVYELVDRCFRNESTLSISIAAMLCAMLIEQAQAMHVNPNIVSCFARRHSSNRRWAIEK